MQDNIPAAPRGVSKSAAPAPSLFILQPKMWIHPSAVSVSRSGFLISTCNFPYRSRRQ